MCGADAYVLRHTPPRTFRPPAFLLAARGGPLRGVPDLLRHRLRRGAGFTVESNVGKACPSTVRMQIAPGVDDDRRMDLLQRLTSAFLAFEKMALAVNLHTGHAQSARPNLLGVVRLSFVYSFAFSYFASLAWESLLSLLWPSS